MRKILLTIAAMISLNLMAWTVPVKYNDIWYELEYWSSSEYWATVMPSYGYWEEQKGTYNGDIVLAETINKYPYDFPVTSVGFYAFYEAEITSIELPSKLEDIRYHAFYGCSQLSYIVCHRKGYSAYAGNYVPSFWKWNSETAKNETIPASDVFTGVDPSIPVYVPDEVVDTYKNSPWGDFFTNILPLSTRPQAIENTTVEVKVDKRIVNGQILILRGEKRYTLQGQEVK